MRSSPRPIVVSFIYCAETEKEAQQGAETWMGNYADTAIRHYEYDETGYKYEDEDQSADPAKGGRGRPGATNKKSSYTSPSYNSMENIADFFASRGKKFSMPKVPVEAPTGKKGFRKGDRVRHPKYGEGMV